MVLEEEMNWKKLFFVFLFLFIISIIYSVISYSNPTEELEGDWCSEIKGTPAWINQDGEISYGYKENFNNQNFNDVVNDYLIPNEISFVYHPECGWCKKQIEYFGDTWNDYKDSGLTLDCSE